MFDQQQHVSYSTVWTPLQVVRTLDVLTPWIQFETRCPVKKISQGEEMWFMSLLSLMWSCFAQCSCAAGSCGESVKSLVLYQLKLLVCLKTCCFNCFDKEIKLLPVLWFVWVLFYIAQIQCGGQKTAHTGLQVMEWDGFTDSEFKSSEQSLHGSLI